MQLQQQSSTLASSLDRRARGGTTGICAPGAFDGEQGPGLGGPWELVDVSASKIGSGDIPESAEVEANNTVKLPETYDRGVERSDWKAAEMMIDHDGEKTNVPQTCQTPNTTDDTVPSYMTEIFSPGAPRKLAPPDVSVANYTLTRLSKVENADMCVLIDRAWGVTEVPSVVPLGDGSYEVVVLRAHCNRLRNWLDAILPLSTLELEYDPVQPTDAEFRSWGTERATTLRKQWFVRRAMGAVCDGWSPAAAYYAHRLELLCLH